MSKTLLKPRPSPEEAIAVVQQAAAHLPRVVTAPEPASSVPMTPPAVSAPADTERAEILNLRLRPSTIREIVRLAEERGLTMKQVVTHALRDFGAQVAPRDLEDHTSRRRGG
jgi:hypothetical protein